MHPSSLLSYYPTYSILDEVLSSSSYKNLNIYIDLKNVFQTLYLEHAIVNLVESSKMSKSIDASIFLSLLSFLAFHKIYSIKRNVKLKFFVFFESGRSYYHLNISKDYKKSRRSDDLYGLDKESRELFFEILSKNYGLIEDAFNRIPSVKVIRLLNLEADFIPYYLVRNKLVDVSKETAHIIYSNDHDLLQCVGKNAFVFSKSAKVKRLVKRSEVMSKFLNCETDIRDVYLPLAMSVIGDSGDDVKGVDKIGAKRFVESFQDLRLVVGGSMKTLYENVEGAKLTFNSSSYSNKYMNWIAREERDKGLISMNLKLVSFELLSRALDNPTSTEMVEKRKRLYKVLLRSEIVPLREMKEALERSGVYIGDDSLDVVYYNSGFE